MTNKQVRQWYAKQVGKNWALNEACGYGGLELSTGDKSMGKSVTMRG